MSYGHIEARQCLDDIGVGSSANEEQVADYIDWLDNNPPPSSTGVGGRRRTRKREVIRHARKLALAKSAGVGFGWWVFISPLVWRVILAVVEWWFRRRDYQVVE